MTTDTALWDRDLPEWNPSRLYALFEIHRQGQPTESERDEYCLQLMRLIGINFGGQKNWMSSLPQSGLDPADAAEEVLFFCLRKTPKFNLDSPCEKVLLKQLNTAISRYVVTLIRGSKSGFNATSATDLKSAVNDPIDSGFTSTVGTELSDYRRVLWEASRSMEDAACGRGVYGDIWRTQRLYRLMCRWAGAGRLIIGTASDNEPRCHILADGSVLFHCPRCDTFHAVDPIRIGFDGNTCRPTFTKWLLVIKKPAFGSAKRRCRCLISDGVIQYEDGEKIELPGVLLEQKIVEYSELPQRLKERLKRDTQFNVISPRIYGLIRVAAGYHS